jgi:8-oxo-dGTP pyrophosphatase MutT (NUDIX family)
MKKIIDKVAWTPIRDRKMLFARTRGKDLFYTVGGKREQGESDIDTLLREAKEEAGVSLDRKSIKHVHTFIGPAHGKMEGMQVSIACYEAQADTLPAPSQEIEELAWLSSKDKERTTETGVMILEWFAQNGYID